MNPFAALDLTRWLVWGVVIASAVSVVWMHGYSRGNRNLLEYQADQARAAVPVVVLQGKVTERVVTRYIKVKEAASAVETVITNEVILYAETTPTGMCLDDDWRRLHDAAALGSVPEGAGRPDGGVRSPGPDSGSEGNDGRQRTRHGDAELRAASPLR